LITTANSPYARCENDERVAFDFADRIGEILKRANGRSIYHRTEALAAIAQEHQLATARFNELEGLEPEEEREDCPNCGGDRYVERMVNRGRENSAGYPIPEYRRELCPECDGTGRRAS
jgi:DNA-directed RNA polymerase subunit M/transcription elongation factor TFIIS